MIGELCEPLNPGELNTVRLVMNVEEARRLATRLANAFGELPKCESNHDTIVALRNILKWALVDEASAQRKKRAAERRALKRSK